MNSLLDKFLRYLFEGSGPWRKISLTSYFLKEIKRVAGVTSVGALKKYLKRGFQLLFKLVFKVLHDLI